MKLREGWRKQADIIQGKNDEPDLLPRWSLKRVSPPFLLRVAASWMSESLSNSEESSAKKENTVKCCCTLWQDSSFLWPPGGEEKNCFLKAWLQVKSSLFTAGKKMILLSMLRDGKNYHWKTKFRFRGRIGVLSMKWFIKWEIIKRLYQENSENKRCVNNDGERGKLLITCFLTLVHPPLQAPLLYSFLCISTFH